MKTIILIVALILVVFLGNFRLLLFNDIFYEKEFDKLNVYEKIPKEEAIKNTNILLEKIHYNTPIETDFFNEKEKQHMDDVQNLMQKAFFLLSISVIAVIIFSILNIKRLSTPFIISGTIIILLVIFSSLINFDKVFLQLHEISFTNDLWKLNPQTDNLIKLFPQQFFYDFVKTVFIKSALIGLILILSGLLLRNVEQPSKIFPITSK